MNSASMTTSPTSVDQYWEILVVDDDKQIHLITEMILKNLEFDNKNLIIHNAYSSEEAKGILLKNPNIATILLDVVMESDDAGLNLVQWIRGEYKNNKIRIILRTGQPGLAPEKEVINNYDINDYREKTDLTQNKLITSVMVALRGYRDLSELEEARVSLEKIIHISHNINHFKHDSIAKELYTQFTSLLQRNTGLSVDENACALLEFNGKREYQLLEGSGHWLNHDFEQSQTLMHKFHTVLENKSSIIEDNIFIACIHFDEQKNYILVVEQPYQFTGLKQEALNLFTSNIALTLTNFNTVAEMEHIQKDIIFILGELVELRGQVGGQHVRRICEISSLLAKHLNLSTQECQLLSLSAALHDIGKISIPEKILVKDGSLSIEEFEIVKSHCQSGFEILKNSNDPVLQQAASIALHHHEHWDGAGYPRGLHGEKIPVFSRIVAIADVYESLRNDRPYGKAWDPQKTKNHILSLSGKQFDPSLVEVFEKNIEELEKLYH